MLAPPTYRAPLVQGQHNDPNRLGVIIAADFDRASRRARWNRLLSRLPFTNNHLLALDAELGNCPVIHQAEQGVRIVPLKEIVGSVGRSQDFDRAFMPRQLHNKQRWMNIDRAYYLDLPLPPVDLLAVDGQYFVLDGHHRISVARMHRQQYIDAHIVTVERRCAPENQG